jgi:anhydro-N-acetylmuramic acid kinase
MIVAGIMSGTSLDGIDVAIVKFGGSKFQVLAAATNRYSKRLRERLAGVSNRQTHTAAIAELNFELAHEYARGLRRVWTKPLDLVGCHGQTIYHSRTCTLQIGDGSVLAELLSAPVVSNFRPRDMAAGGAGAPLVPFFDYRVFRHPRIHRVALNLGGIANITVIPAGARREDVIAFDTGPANMVIDQLVETHTGGRMHLDRGGRLGASGKVDQALLERLMRDPFFRRRPPKTAGREQYGTEFAAQLPAGPDGIATATAFTATTVATAIQRFAPQCQEVIAGGGGVHNPLLMSYLAGFLPGVRILTVDEFGVSADSKEAVAFAMLAYETWRGRPSNVPSATGAKRAVILGQIAR